MTTTGTTAAADTSASPQLTGGGVGDGASAAQAMQGNDAPFASTDGSGFLAIVLASVAAVLLLALVAIGVLFRRARRRKATPATTASLIPSPSSGGHFRQSRSRDRSRKASQSRVAKAGSVASARTPVYAQVTIDDESGKASTLSTSAYSTFPILSPSDSGYDAVLDPSRRTGGAPSDNYQVGDLGAP
mmetsp:Transcript_2597/g.8291  ORF Transcript_2597/g.8291 Transcript_2597/m.8291 type:complete len:188 (-) Transcript_2597:76-639(-)